jgi:hypothetical protein
MIKILNIPGTGLQTEPILIESNSSVLICATHTFIIGYDLIKFDEKFFLTNIYSSFPLTLSTRWLAFVDYRLFLVHQSSGGINGNISEQYASYTGVMLNAAKSLSKSVVKIGESVLGYSGQQINNSNLNEKSSPPKQQFLLNNNTNNNNNNTSSTRHRHGSGKDEAQAGIITIVDTFKLFGVRKSKQRIVDFNLFVFFRSHQFMMKDKIGSLLIFKLILNRSDIYNLIQVDIYLSHVIIVDIILMY